MILETAANPHRISIEVRNPRPSAAGGSHIEYEVAVTLETDPTHSHAPHGPTAVRQWSVHRRYREFSALDAALRRRYGHSMELVVLPPAPWFGGENPSFLAERRRLLHAYAAEVLRRCPGALRASGAHDSPELAVFLQWPPQRLELPAPITTTRGSGGGGAAHPASGGAPPLSPHASALLSGASALLRGVACSAPFGSALGLLASALERALLLGENYEEARLLHLRLSNLLPVLKEAGADADFVARHGALFDALLATLQSAEAFLERMGPQRSFAAYLRAGANAAELAALDEELSARLQEFAAALQVATLVSVRGLAAEGTTAAAAVAAPEPPPPFSMSLRLRDFALEAPLSEPTAAGAPFGTLAHGTWLELRLGVTVKLLPAAGAQGGMRAWLAGAELMRRLSEGGGSRHVARLLGIGTAFPHYLVALERCDGGTLRGLLDRYRGERRTPALAAALGWVAGVARGVAECAAQGVAHGDVRAGNVLLTTRREVRLGDLVAARLARALAPASSPPPEQLAPWCAPELLREGAAPTPAGDVFAWAITAWEVLSLFEPYQDTSGAPATRGGGEGAWGAVASGVLRPDLALLRPDAPPALLALMMRAWASDAAQRPLIGEVVAGLE